MQVLVPLDGSPKVGEANRIGSGQVAAGAAASGVEGLQGGTRGLPAPAGHLLGMLTECRHAYRCPWLGLWTFWL